MVKLFFIKGLMIFYTSHNTSIHLWQPSCLTLTVIIYLYLKHVQFGLIACEEYIKYASLFDFGTYRSVTQ